MQNCEKQNVEGNSSNFEISIFFFFWIEAKTTPRNLFFIILFSLQLVFKITSIEGKKWVEFVALQLNNATWLKHNERYSRGLPLKQYSSRPEK